MKNATIKELAYIIKQSKKNNQPQPIFFLGAGASKTGNIPLARDIITDILNKFPNAPAIQKLNEDEKSYSKLMECLQPYERDELLKGYINEAKINVTHIYLAQLIKNGYVDYVLTVNFDNLMLRALALFNEFPPTYDMAILKDLTTTTFKEKSVIFLHGQHHGLWLLNTTEEMKKVKAIVPRIFDSIKNRRPWIFIGYSGEDPIFEHIKNLGRFDNGLYWVTYNDNSPNDKVQSFLETPNTNSFIIRGFDSDSFMLKLNTELELEQPEIINKPFTSIKKMLNNIVDIDDDEHFKGVKERLEISKRQVDETIQQFEEGNVETTEKIKKTLEIDLLKKEIIDLLIIQSYQKENIERIENNAKQLSNKEINSLLAGLYSDWGIYFGNLAKTKEGKQSEELYNQAFEKYQRAIEIKPDKHEAFNNWGNDLGDLARTKKGKLAEELYNQAFEKYQRAIALGASSYNLACLYALKGKKTKALAYLEKCLKKQEIKISYVKKDPDWKNYLEDTDFIKLLKKYEN
ncbi:MAG: SIR2 family protein [Bacteroidetes bacterium]|nr:SIR2 family protein [Bacteroidota bacterium]